jgi:hypothetical protein
VTSSWRTFHTHPGRVEQSKMYVQSRTMCTAMYTFKWWCTTQGLAHGGTHKDTLPQPRRSVRTAVNSTGLGAWWGCFPYLQVDLLGHTRDWHAHSCMPRLGAHAKVTSTAGALGIERTDHRVLTSGRQVRAAQSRCERWLRALCPSSGYQRLVAKPACMCRVCVWQMCRACDV